MARIITKSIGNHIVRYDSNPEFGRTLLIVTKGKAEESVLFFGVEIDDLCQFLQEILRVQ